MAKKWLKSTVVVESERAGAEKPMKRSYPNVAESATEDQLLAFGNLIAQLSDEIFNSTQVTSTNALVNPVA